MIVTFCGHSQYVATSKDEQKMLYLLETVVGDRVAELFLGGYGSFDSFARKCGRKFQQTHPNVRLIFVSPYMTLDYQKNHLENQKRLYDEVLYAELESVPPKFAISHRNKWMVERANCVIAYIVHAWGGAYQSYCHAKRKNKLVFNIADVDI